MGAQAASLQVQERVFARRCKALRDQYCILSLEETGRLEHYGMWPSCKNHPHVFKSYAKYLVNRDTHRFVGGQDTKIEFASAIVPVNTSRNWQPVQCRGEDGAILMGLRTWGLVPAK